MVYNVVCVGFSVLLHSAWVPRRLDVIAAALDNIVTVSDSWLSIERDAV